MLITIYIPTKNRLKLLNRAIESIKKQTYKDIEIIVVDDGSTDGTTEYLTQEINSGTLKAIFNKKSLGACVARNKAIEMSTGDFITGLDDDDYFISPHRIEWFLEKWNSQGGSIGGIFDSVYVSTATGNYKRHETQTVTHKNLREYNLVGSQIFAPKSHYVKAGLFDPNMPAWQDWDLWLRISRKFGPFININKSSYMVDEMHDAERITVQNQDKIRVAMQRMSNKIENLSLREKSSLTISMLAYKQVKPTITDLTTLLFALRMKTLLNSTRKLLL